jgi:hypothetical protein
MNSTARFLCVATFLVALSLFSAEPAEARKGIPIINTGDVIYRVADLPAELAANPELAGWALGYKASHFGLFWADVWCWDKQLVAFKGDSYSDLEPALRAQLEAQFPWNKCKRNLWTRFGFLGMLLVGAGAAVFKLRQSG